MIIKNLKKYNLKYYKECGVKLTNDYYYNSSDEDEYEDEDDEDDEDTKKEADEDDEDDEDDGEDDKDNNGDYNDPSIYINQSEAKALQKGPTNNIITPTNQIKIIKK